MHFGMNRANCDTIIKLGMWHFFSYQIHSVRLANRKSQDGGHFPRWRPFSKMATNKSILHFIELDLIGRINLFVCQNECFEYAEVSSEYTIIPMYNYNACDITR